MGTRTGNPGPWPQPTSYGRNDTGQYSSIPFESTDANQINILAAQFDAAGYNYQVEHSFGKSKIMLQLAFNQQAGQEVPIDLWEYTAQSAQKALMSSIIPGTLLDGLTPRLKNLISWALQQKSNASESAPGEIDDPTNPAWWINILGAQEQPNTNYDLCAKVYSVLADGTEDFVVSAPILRHTQTTSFQYPITLSLLNYGRIISTPTLLSLEPTMPPSIANNLPKDLQLSTGTKRYGWKKEFPTIQQIAFRKVQSVQEFSYGLWETQIYSPNPPVIL